MSNQPPYPGQPEQPGPPGPQGPPPQGPPPGQPPFPPPAGPYGAPPPNPYGQPPQGPYAPQTQPLWQGHQAPQQTPGQYGWQPYGAPHAAPKGNRTMLFVLLGLLVAALVAAGVVGAVLLAGDSDSGTAVSDLSVGDCLTSKDLAQAKGSIGDIETVDCEEEHDAEVFATLDLESDEDLDAAGSRCVDEAADEGHPLEDLQGDDLEIRPLAAEVDPQEGDTVVCFIRNQDGDKLSGAIFK